MGEIKTHENKNQDIKKCNEIKPQKNVDVDKAKEYIKNNYEKQEGEKNPKGEMIKNKQDGLAREGQVEKQLQKENPNSTIISESYLRDKDGKIVKDPVTGEARRVDFVVVSNGKVDKMVEVTSLTASKDKQMAKENRIRENGGQYIKDNNGNLIKIPSNVKTKIERRA